MMQDDADRPIPEDRENLGAGNPENAGETPVAEATQGFREEGDDTEQLGAETFDFSAMTSDEVRDRAREQAKMIEALPSKLSSADVARAAVEALAPEIERAMARGYSASEAIAAADLPGRFGMKLYIFVNAYRAWARSQAGEADDAEPGRKKRRKKSIRRFR